MAMHVVRVGYSRPGGASKDQEGQGRTTSPSCGTQSPQGTPVPHMYPWAPVLTLAGKGGECVVFSLSLGSNSPLPSHPILP